MILPLSQFSLADGILCRTVSVHEQTVTQLVIPTSLVPTVLQLIHDAPQSGHPGRDKSLTMARKRYYWPTMNLDITNHVAQCVSCAQTKGTTHTAPMLEYPTPSGPFDTIAIDLLQLPRSHQGSTYVLVCVDHFSRFVILAPLPNKSAPVVAHALVSRVLCQFTTPSVLLSDNGTEFKNEVLQNICQQYNIAQCFITAHHPASNGLVERTNRKILEILRHVAGTFHESWEDWLPHVAASINGSVNSSTGKTPHYIVFGEEKRLPYDILVGPRVPMYSADDYVKSHIRTFQLIHASVRDKLQASRAEMIARQYLTATPVSLGVGDTVFKASPLRQSKLESKFSGPYLITESLSGNKLKIFDPSLNISEIVHVDRLKKSRVPIPTSDNVMPQSPPVSHTSVSPTHSYNLRSRAM